MSQQTVLICLSKAIRSFFNGAVSTVLIYVFYRIIYYQHPLYISLILSCTLLANTIKSFVFTRLAKCLGDFNIVALSALLHIIPLIATNGPNLSLRGGAMIFTILFALGFFPIDGEEITIVESIQRKWLRESNKEKKNVDAVDALYKRIGYCLQAVGSICAAAYLYFRMEEDYDEKIKVHEILIALCLYPICSFFLYVFINANKGKQTQSIALEDDKYNIQPKKIFRFRLHNFVDGFSFGLLSAPFIAYFCELKLDFYYDGVGWMLAAFFLLKGVGHEIISAFSHAQRVLSALFVLSNVALAAITFFPTPAVSTACLLFAFPLWHYGRAQLEEWIAAVDARHVHEALREELCLYERVGAAAGLLACTFSFTTLYFRPYFAYAFLLSAVVRQLNVAFISKEDRFDYLTIFSDEEMSEMGNGVAKASQDSSPKPSVAKNDANESKLKTWFGIIIVVGFVGLFSLLYFQVLQDGKYYSLFRIGNKGVKVRRPEDMHLFNSSLAAFLQKQGITQARLIDCGVDCQTLVAGDYPSLIINDRAPQWLHFPQAPYFTSEESAAAYFADVAKVDAEVKGFSVFWKHPLRYHKIRQSIRDFLKTFPEKHGFYFQQMPSLNLRGVENKIVLIFSREQRKPVTLPPFVQKQPPKNFLAFQTTFKMALTLPELREFILYHLNMGVDKFFLYDNEIGFDDPNLYECCRIVQYLTECPRFNHSEEHAIFMELWQDFYDHIVYIPWIVPNVARNLGFYPQFQAYEHYSLYFKQSSRYTIFTDLDEFIFSPSGKHLSDTLAELEDKHDMANINLYSQQFLYQICQPEALVIEQTQWGYEAFQNLTFKVIAMNEVIARSGVHGRQTKSGNFAPYQSPLHDFILYHYQLTTEFYKMKNPNYESYREDKSLLPMAKGLKQSCNGKCTDSFKPRCSKQVDSEIRQKLCYPPK